MTKARDLGDFISDGTIAETVTADGLNLGDNEKIQLGASQDLQIFHDGSHSIVKDSGTGNLKLLAENFSVQDPNQTEQMILATPNGSVNLYYNGSKMFETTATGATVTGTIAVSGVFNATSGTFTVQSNGTAVLNLTSTLMSPQTDGAISLGSASNAFNNLHLDGSAYVAGSVGIGVTSVGDATLEIQPATDIPQIKLTQNNVGDSGDGWKFHNSGPTGGNLAFVREASGSDTEYLRLGTSGQLGLSGANYGTSGQVLTSGGSGAAPAWADAGGGSEIIRVARTSNTALTSSNAGNLIDITSGTFTQTFAASSSLADGWFVYLRNSGTGVITLDPNSTETIDGLTTFVLYPGDTRIVQCDGSNLRTIMLKGGTQTFTSSGSFIVPPHVTGFIVDAWGGGGGGGGGSQNDGRSGAGGGGGAHVQMKLDAIAAGTSVTVTVAGGGAGGSANGYGGGGGISSFGSYTKAYGGYGPGPHGGGGAGSRGSGTQGTVLNEYSGQGYPVVNISNRNGGQAQVDVNIFSQTGGGGAIGINGSSSSVRDGYSAEWGGGSGAPYVGSDYGGRGGSSIYGGGGGGAGGGGAAPGGGEGGATNAWQQGGGGGGGANGSAGSSGADGSGLYSGAGGGGGGNGAVGGAGGFPSGGGGGGGKGNFAGGAGGAGKVVVTYF